MLVVQSDGVLNGFVADHVAVGEVLGDNARTRLIFLLDLVLAGTSFPGCLTFFAASGAGELGYAGSRGNLDLGRAELGVVEEESGLSSSVGMQSVGEGLGGLNEELTFLSRT